MVLCGDGSDRQKERKAYTVGNSIWKVNPRYVVNFKAPQNSVTNTAEWEIQERLQIEKENSFWSNVKDSESVIFRIQNDDFWQG